MNINTNALAVALRYLNERCEEVGSDQCDVECGVENVNELKTFFVEQSEDETQGITGYAGFVLGFAMGSGAIQVEFSEHAPDGGNEPDDGDIDSAPANTTQD